MNKEETALSYDNARLRAELEQARAELEERREIDRILSMSDEDVLAEARGEGLDPDAFATEMRGKFDTISRLLRRAETAEADAAKLREALAAVDWDEVVTRLGRDHEAEWGFAAATQRDPEQDAIERLRDAMRGVLVQEGTQE